MTKCFCVGYSPNSKSKDIQILHLFISSRENATWIFSLPFFSTLYLTILVLLQYTTYFSMFDHMWKHTGNLLFLPNIAVLSVHVSLNHMDFIFLYVVWDRSPKSFFHIQITNVLISIYWKVWSFSNQGAVSMSSQS